MFSVIKSCLTVFFGRIVDVSFATVKTVLTVKERTVAAALFGFCEVFVWFIVVRDALNSDMPSIVLALAYACGYACGTLIGGWLARNLIPGRMTVEVITSDRSDKIPAAMREAGYALTVINVNESEFGAPKYYILADVDKKRVPVFEKRVRELDPGAFIMLRETKGSIGGFSGK